MIYTIISFDGYNLPLTLQTPDQETIGTGQALNSYMQLPDGYYDNYGTYRAPRGLQPIVKTGVLYRTDSAELFQDLDGLRAKIGVSGNLVIRMSDGSIRWQTARLREVNVRNPFEANGMWAPFNLRWETVSQYWYGEGESGAEWIIGDLSWTLGDGTASLGQGGNATVLTASPQIVSITNNGNIESGRLTIIVTAGTSDLADLSVTYQNNLEFAKISDPVVAGDAFVLNGGGRSVTNGGVDAFGDFRMQGSTWPIMDPGQNDYEVTFTGNATQDATIEFEYNDVYA